MTRRVTIICNPMAGRRRRGLADDVVAELARLGVPCTFVVTEGPDHATVLAREADADLVVAAGGDGTVNEVVHGLMTRDEALPRPLFAQLPLGTINVLALELGLPRAPAALAGVFAEGTAIAVPVGRANDRHFLLTAGAGVDAAAVRFLSWRAKRWFGQGAYYLALIQALIAEGNTVFDVEVGGDSYRVSSVIVTNASRYAGDKVVAPSLRLTDDVVHVLLGMSHGRRHLIRYGIAYMRGTLPFQSDVRIIPAKRLRIAGPRRKPVQLDGDNRLETPVDIEVCDTPLMVVAGLGDALRDGAVGAASG